MKLALVTNSLDMALEASVCDQAAVVHKPRLISDNGWSNVAAYLAAYLNEQAWIMCAVRRVIPRRMARSSASIRI